MDDGFNSLGVLVIMGLLIWLLYPVTMWIYKIIDGRGKEDES